MIELLKKIPENRFPHHIAIIMDGNRRWARLRGFPSIYGHREGVKTVKKIVKAAKTAGVKYLTLYVFSTENWKRSAKEIGALLSLLKKTISEYREKLKENNISLKISGDISSFPPDIRDNLKKSINFLSDCNGMILNLALNYGGRSEIVYAVNRCIEDGIKKIKEEDISKRLYTFPLPDPDLMIRTSGEARISNFLLWQLAYSELYISEKLWPDFSEEDFYNAIISYSNRERRMGR
ncbi:MAG: di-trans,poly-cis-decaprenylcistransferase [Elusimicrobiota bacterium]